MNRAIIILIVVLLSVFSGGCARNAMWRANEFKICAVDNQTSTTRDMPSDCDTAHVEKHDDFDLAYIEFTERGNLFDRELLNGVIDHINSAKKETPVTVVVFVHGWTHNADPEDSNVREFRRVLHALSRDGARRKVLGGSRLIGVYLGWRGRSLIFPLVDNISYWDRKAVAEEVGKGGVTEIMLRLRLATLRSEASLDPVRLEGNSNSFLVVGHSFGGAIVLSALNELLLESLLSASALPEENCRDLESGLVASTIPESLGNDKSISCKVAEPFAHGVVLLNPAIEANQALQLKEVATENSFSRRQFKLMHVLSTDGDKATHYAFPAGQTIGLLFTWNQRDLERAYRSGEPMVLREEDLDTETVGNFAPYLTGRMTINREKSSWNYHRCSDGLKLCKIEDAASWIPTQNFHPLSFISTGEKFMGGHSDIFNCNVAAYLSAIVLESRAKASKTSSSDNGELSGCGSDLDNYNFGGCFDSLQKVLRGELSQYLERLEFGPFARQNFENSFCPPL